MKIAIVILGTRGDVQPMVALAKGLTGNGHDVVICAPPENEQLVVTNNCRFIKFGPEIKKQINENPQKQKGGVAVKISPKQGKKLIGDQINILPELIKPVDLVLATGIVMGVQTAADILKVPYRLVAFYPILLGTTPEDPLKNRMMFAFGRKMINLFIRGFINKNRAKYQLPPIKDAWHHWLGDNVIMACDRELVEARKEVAFSFTQTAYMILPSKNQLPDGVENFINSGKPPVYIGFGSNPITGPEKYGQIFIEVQQTTQQRLIVSKGWANLPENNNENILYVDDMPFELLFPRLVAVVYHGGTGTMSAVARAGVPHAAFPFMGDQFMNRDQIVKLNLGPKTCNFKKISTRAISNAIMECINNETYKKNAVEMAQKLKNVNGVELTVNLIEKEFGR
ncbi:MAG: glycosyltransferase [Bacteroidales bacterium]